jgi:hypothetical protein
VRRFFTGEEFVADYVRSECPDFQLHTCNDEEGNCGRCEKCCRTAIGLFLAGLDPAAHGYEGGEGLFEHARTCLEAGRWVLGEDERVMWADIRDHAPPERACPPAAESFFEWLADADLAALVARSNPPVRGRLVQAIVRNTPYSVYSLLRSRAATD